MASPHSLRGAAALVCCFAYACSSNSGTQAGSNPPASGTTGNSGAISVEHRNIDDSSNDAQAGAAGEAAVQRRNVTQDGSAGAIDEGSAGEGPTSDSVPPSGIDQQHTQCDVNTSCQSNGKSTVVTCGVESIGFTCEFEGFVGATADVASGQRVVIGTACCGGCGCTAVEVYFDGTHCWQGIPECTLPEFTNRMYYPHRTTKPNPSFTPPSTAPGNFYVGTGGVGGSAPTATAGAPSTGGTSGMDSGGAPAAGAPAATAGTGGANAGSSSTAGVGGAPATAGAAATP